MRANNGDHLHRYAGSSGDGGRGGREGEAYIVGGVGSGSDSSPWISCSAVRTISKPSLQHLFWVKTPCWLKWWRIWGRENSKPFSLMTIMVNLEMWSVTSVLRRKTNPSSPVWCVWNLTVKNILSVTKNFTQKSDTKWLMPPDNWRRWSALYMIDC